MKVSIVTPSYNQGRFIEQTLQSVAIQTGADIEHIVFDGGSTDNTVEILQRFTPPVRWTSKRDKGQTEAINNAIRTSTGQIIGWLNSDDIYYPGTVARVVEYFTSHPDVDVVYGMADHVDVEGRAFEDYPTRAWDFLALKETCFICQPAVFFRRQVIESHGLLDESLHYCMDYEYWLRLGKAGVRFGYLEEKLAGSRLYADNKTLGSRVKVHREINDMLKKQFAVVPDRWLFNYAHAVVEGHVSRDTYPKFFAFRIGLTSIVAALKWNTKVSAEMLGTVRRWLGR